MTISKKPGLKLNWSWKIRLNCHELLLHDDIKYLGIYLNKYLNDYYQSKIVVQKLAKALSMLSKVRHYVAKTELQNIYPLYLNPIYDINVKFGFNLIHNI